MTLTKPLVSAKRYVICNTGAAGKVVGCGMAFGVFRSWPRGGGRKRRAHLGIGTESETDACQTRSAGPLLLYFTLPP